MSDHDYANAPRPTDQDWANTASYFMQGPSAPVAPLTNWDSTMTYTDAHWGEIDQPETAIRVALNFLRTLV